MPNHSVQHPFDFFTAIFCLNLDRAADRRMMAARRHRTLGIAHRVERFSAYDTPANYHLGCTLSWRSMIAEAKNRGYANILILEDDAIFRHDTNEVLQAAIKEIAGVEWDLFYLGGALHGEPTMPIGSRKFLRQCGWIACTHALAVHERCYQFILDGIPELRGELEARVHEGMPVDQFLGLSIADGHLTAVITEPRVATQRELMAYEGGDLATADSFTI